MKKIVICDDVEIDRSILRHFLEKYFDDRGEEALVEEYSSGESLTADVEEGYLGMDLLFLDIFMNGINGMETAVKLRALSCTAPIVFLTMSPDFAVESYEVEASGYILKPFSASQLVRLLEKTLKTGDRNRVAVKTGYILDTVALFRNHITESYFVISFMQPNCSKCLITNKFTMISFFNLFI